MQNKEQHKAMPSVPVAVDSVKQIETFHMTRCTYFSLENSEPEAGWSIDITGINIDFDMLALSGVITSPPGDLSAFDSAENIDLLFAVVEQNPRLLIDVNEIWLPNALLDEAGIAPYRGQVLRIGHALFSLAYELKETVTTDEEFLKRMQELKIPAIMEYSARESSALHAWNERQIEVNRQHYHANPQRKLQKKREGPDPSPPVGKTG